MATQPKRDQIDWSSFSNNIKHAASTTQNTPSNNINTDLGGNGATVSFTVSGTAYAFVTVNVALASTSDYEHRPQIFLDGSLHSTATYAANISGTAAGRAAVRSFSNLVTLTSGTHTISAGIFTSSATSPVVPTDGANVTVIVFGNVTA